MRAAFLASFHEDGVFVRQGWTPAKAWLRTRPAPPIVLDWRPVYVETAASGELGLSTGPWKITSKAQPAAAPSHGQFVSVWTRAGDGPWKVAADLGIDHPGPLLWDRPQETVAVRAAGSTAAGSLGAAEARFARDGAYGGARSAYLAHGAGSLRFYRPGAPPAIGRAAALASPAMNEDKLVYTIEHTQVARSGDLGYTRGSYAAANAPAVPLGAFLRAWRLEGGDWRIALDVTHPAT
jgi:ketosteroid isomerase-like protein